jgi:hypothetical protein
VIYLFVQLVRLYIYALVTILVVAFLLCWTFLWLIGRVVVLAIEAGQRRRVAYPAISAPVDSYRKVRS